MSRTPKDVKKVMIAIGPFAFGFGDSSSEAIKNCKEHCRHSGVISVLLCHEDTKVSHDDGGLQYPIGEHPVLIDTVKVVKR